MPLCGDGTRGHHGLRRRGLTLAGRLDNVRSSARAGDGRSSGTSRAIALVGIRLGPPAQCGGVVYVPPINADCRVLHGA
jgi:hypothetical protein